MPKVKKTRRKKKTTKRGANKQSRISAFRDIVSRLGLAVGAGLGVVAAIALFFFWSGGYFGLLGERMNRAVAAVSVSAGFEVRKITAKGFENVSERELLDAVGPVIGTSMLHFDPYAARARVEELGWVRAAAVSRLLPDTIHISVREREPAAVWQLSGALYLIDPAGAVIRSVDAFEYSNLPLIVGAGAPAAAAEILQALRAEPAIWGAAAALIRVGDRRWNLRLKSGGDVKFPETGIEQAVRDLAVLDEQFALLDAKLEYVDLRDPNNLVYREIGAREDVSLQEG